MRLVDGGKPSKRELAFAEFATSNWDISDPAQAEEAAHSALAMLSALAVKWNPYWVIGLMQVCIDAIGKSLEESDE